MPRRQTVPSQWLIVTGDDGLHAARRLPRALRRLRTIARSRDLRVAIEGRRMAARVHNAGELHRALLARTPLVLLSPIYPTATHPEWAPIPRMRAAALARLGERRLVALGGLNSKRYAAVERLGFIGWVGISAFRT